ncbi:peptide deformylase [Candidatus Saccharibacteria bacterium]|nr:peptide deformylase [Candidatus Saccharibacteria bacterium]
MKIAKTSLLRRTQFGNPILRTKARQLAKSEILSPVIKKLITDMRYTLAYKKYGVGLAAPQIGQGVALCIIEIKPTKLRPKLPKSKWASLIVVNPKIVKVYGRRQQVYEGCISFAEVFAKVPRHKKIRVKYLNEKAATHQKDFKGLVAQVLQHEIDHLNGILFVDKVKDTSSYMTAAEYKKRIVKNKKQSTKNKKQNTISADNDK